jgi:arylsulfatase B
MNLAILIFVSFCVSLSKQQVQTKKNVVVIMVDDLGYNDVSYRGSNEIPTPNIDALAYNGAILNRFYTPPLCTPSRASLMTCKYPFRSGMQHFVIPSDEPWSLGKNEKLLPQYFKQAGYSTSLIGKWHLGFYQKQFMPTQRGFDSFFGYVGPYIDYFDYTLNMFDRSYSRGFDMRRNETIANDFNPIYATDLFTNEAIRTINSHDKKKPMFMLLTHLAPHAGNEDFPMQAPEEEIKKFSYIANVKRRTLAGEKFLSVILNRP